jgi:hypothetical protein
MTKRTRLPRRQFLAAAGVVLTGAAVSGNPAWAQVTGQLMTRRLPAKVGVAPGYIVSGRGEHLSNPYFLPQGQASHRRMPLPRAAHGKGVMEDDTP